MFKKQHNGSEIIYRASVKFRDRKWYDFADIKYNTGFYFYPAKILGFEKFTGGHAPNNNQSNNKMYAVVHKIDPARLEN